MNRHQRRFRRFGPPITAATSTALWASSGGASWKSPSNANAVPSDASKGGTSVLSSWLLRGLAKGKEWVDTNFFLLGMVIAVLLAKIVPSLGKNGGILRPELFLGNYGVTMIFFLSGLSLQTSELTQAVTNVKLNGLIQFWTFAIWPFVIGPTVRYLLLKTPFQSWVSPALTDGILILTTLPTTVNMCIMLTTASGGNVATAICNAVLSNLAGILLTPLLLVRLFGTGTITLPFLPMVWQLCQRVLLPVLVGQVLRTTSVRTVATNYSKTLKRIQELVLLGIVWNAFCNAFTDGLGLGLKDGLTLLGLLSTLHLIVLGTCFYFFSIPTLQFDKSEQVAASFCASHKTLAFGLPLVNTIFQGNPNLASYCAPIMFIHPLQATIGSILVPSIQRYVSSSSPSTSSSTAIGTDNVPPGGEDTK